jgi:hypothetical protein
LAWACHIARMGKNKFTTFKNSKTEQPKVPVQFMNRGGGGSPHQHLVSPRKLGTSRPPRFFPLHALALPKVETKRSNPGVFRHAAQFNLRGRRRKDHDLRPLTSGLRMGRPFTHASAGGNDRHRHTACKTAAAGNLDALEPLPYWHRRETSE